MHLFLCHISAVVVKNLLVPASTLQSTNVYVSVGFAGKTKFS